MKWYFPSWNGDIRIEVDPENPARTIITAIEPTADEERVLKSLASILHGKGWMKRKTLWYPNGKKKKTTDSTVVAASMLEIGTLMISHLKPGLATLTAIKMKDGTIEAMANSDKGILAWLTKLFGSKGEGSAEIGAVKDLADALEAGTAGDPNRSTKEEAKAIEKKEPEKAATVKRPTPSCPQCYVDAVEPATEVLLDFLDEEQHEQWAKDRSMIVTGGLTGHRYLLAHRSSEKAAKVGKICYDLDDGGVLHFHDHSVPPEEEILAAMLCLKFREPWLRNEATCLSETSTGMYMVGGCGGYDFVFKNPFGDGADGIADSNFIGELGSFVRGFLTTYENGAHALPADRNDPNAETLRAITRKLVNQYE